MINTNDVDWKTMGERIGEEMHRHNLTMQELGEMIGVPRQTVSKWIHGKAKNIAAQQLLGLSRALHCEVGYLLGEYPHRTYQSACVHDITGLSEEAIEALSMRREKYESEIEVLSSMLTKDGMWEPVLSQIAGAKDMNNARVANGETTKTSFIDNSQLSCSDSIVVIMLTGKDEIEQFYRNSAVNNFTILIDQVIRE